MWDKPVKLAKNFQYFPDGWGRETGGSSCGHDKEAAWCRTSRHPHQYGKSSKHIQESGMMGWGRETVCSSCGHDKEAAWCRTSKNPHQYGLLMTIVVVN